MAVTDMAKSSKVLATYRINVHEAIQVSVTAASAYPDGLAEAAATARRLVRDMLADVMEYDRTPAEVEPESE